MKKTKFIYYTPTFKLLRLNQYMIHGHFYSYLKYFNFYSYALVGLKISPLFNEFKQRKKWILRKLKFKTKFNFRLRRLLGFKPYWKRRLKLKAKKKKKILIQEPKIFFYLNSYKLLKLKLNYRNFKFLIKIIKTAYPINKSAPAHQGPYLFLNSNKNLTKKAPFPLKIIYKLFKTHKKLFRLFKKQRFKSKNKARLYFNRFTHKKNRKNKKLIKIYRYRSFFRKFFKINKRKKLFKFKHFLFLTFTVNIINNFKNKTYFLKILNVKSKKHNHKHNHKYKYKVNRRFFKKMRKLTRNLTYSFLRLALKFNYKHLANFLKFYTFNEPFKWMHRRRKRKTYYFFKNLKKLNFTVFSLKKTNYIKSRLLLSKIESNNIIFSSINKFDYFNNLHKVSFKFKLNKKFFYLRKIKNYFFNYINNSLFSAVAKKSRKFFKVFPLRKNREKLVLFPFHFSRFILTFIGFFSIIHFVKPFLHYKKSSKIYSFKKFMYSFSFKEDMPKHLLWKHSKFKLTSYFVNFSWKKKKIMSNKTHNKFVKQKYILYNNFIVQNFKNTFSSNFNHLNSVLHQNLYDTTSRFINLSLKNKRLKNPKFKGYIKKIRFRPGVIRYWRRARKDLLPPLQLNFKYQHQLTRYLILHKKTIYMQSLALYEMRLSNILLKSRFVLDQIFALKCIENKIVFINGICCFNAYTQIFLNDFIQFIISFKYYITFRWLLSKNFKNKKYARFLNWKTKQKKKKNNKTTKYINCDIPLNILPHKIFISDVAKYMEVDFFTLSIFLLYDPFLWADFNMYNALTLKYGVFNLYNWKYIT